jgi:predicted AlkP superfamily phosphohydrolase/phosphomutase
MDRGLAPTFRSLRDRGTSGDVEALWPPYWSGAAWGSILTGLPREATGVYEDLGGVAPGLSPFQVPLLSSFKLNPIYTARSLLRAARMIDYVPPPRALLRGKPVWQLLHEAGVNSAVIRFRFTYPPTDQADVMVSDWIGSDPWEEMGVRHLNTPDTVAPASLAQELLAPFRPESAAPTLFSRLVPGPEPRQPADAILDPFAHIRAAADVDERSFQASMVVLRHNPRQPFLAVYIGGLDSAEHAFWQYRFPEDFTSNLPAAEDVKRFAPVIDRYVQFVDERLKMLLAQYDAEPNIVVVSDHGHGASTILGGWRGWHTRTGVFLAAGPSVPKTDVRLKVSYYDIVPTLASLKGLQKSSGLRGVALFREKQSSDVVSNSH